MPVTRVETRAGWISERREEVIAAIGRAVATGLHLADPGTLIVTEHAETAFRAPPGVGQRYVLVDVVLFAGRSAEWKLAVKHELAAGLAGFGLAASDINLTFHEVDPSNAP